MRRLLTELGEPQLAVPSVLVAGTNGKGSTTALVARIARAAGLRTGTFVSPHLETYFERVATNGRSITDDRLAEHLETILARAEATGADPPTYFEAFTLVGFLEWRARDCDLAVLEVGLGGRLDATNSASPLASIVTSIGFDHQKQLGSTLREIAGEKAGIARKDRPLLAWATPQEVYDSLEAKAIAVGANLIAVDREVMITPLETARITPGSSHDHVHSHGARRQRFRLETPEDRYELELALLGAHQRRNAALAVRTAERLRAADADRFPFTRESIEAGVAACRWPARLEWVELPPPSGSPEPAPRRVLLDAGHNPAGIAETVRYTRGLGHPVHLLFGAVGDKAIAQMLPPLAALASRVTLTRPPSPRAKDPHDWLPLLEGSGDTARPEVIADPAEALEAALAQLPPGGTLLACGSIYLVGALRLLLRERYGVPEPPTS